MVGELHQAGYEQLRICPTIANSGLYWLCWIAPASDVFAGHGGVLAPPTFAQASVCLQPESSPAALYISAKGDQYFGWPDAADDTPLQLAEKFTARFPTVATAGWGTDSDYMLWFQTMLQLTEPLGFPSTYAGSPETSSRLTQHLAVLGDSMQREVPLPPPGRWTP